MQQIQLQLQRLIALRKINASVGCLKTRSLQCTRPMHHQCHCTMSPQKNHKNKTNALQHTCQCNANSNEIGPHNANASPMPTHDPCQCYTRPDLHSGANANARSMPMLNQTRLVLQDQCKRETNAMPMPTLPPPNSCPTPTPSLAHPPQI